MNQKSKNTDFIFQHFWQMYGTKVSFGDGYLEKRGGAGRRKIQEEVFGATAGKDPGRDQREKQTAQVRTERDR